VVLGSRVADDAFGHGHGFLATTAGILLVAAPLKLTELSVLRHRNRRSRER
jgi:hypothetical protein